MKKSKKSARNTEEGVACSSSGGGGRLFPRLSLQRFLYGNPLLPGNRRTSGQRSHRRGQTRETATKSTSTVEVQNVGVEVATGNVDISPSSSIPAPLPPSPLPSPASSPSSSSELHPAPPAQDESKSRLQLECPLCLAELPAPCFPALSTCEHRSCYDCLQQYLRVEISESRTSIACPECSERLHPNDVRMILNDKNVYAKYEDFMVRRVLAVDPDTRWCPQPDCGFAVIASGCASCPKLRCLRPGCSGVFCYHCKADWHPNQTCDAAREQRRSLPLLLSIDAANNAAAGNNAPSTPSINPLSRDSDIKPCPRCSVLIVKMDDGSCNHMTCAVCGAEFCWLCMKEISDLHYLSPSGCTFWGKKPWSRKKKILWQLGTLVGAPVGIGLVAGIALPAMMIGIPVWVGRKLYGRYKHSNKHKRNLVIASGVTASIFVSPLVAGLVVSIGVPILLFYIYGVVPVSLCRSGGCDVSTSSSGFHFDFDDYSEAEEEEEGEEGGEGTDGRGSRRLVTTELGARLGYRGGNIADAIPLDTGSHKGTNPSIGEASLSMDSGSHLEREDEEEGEEGRHPGKHAEHRNKRSCMEVQAEVQPTSLHRLSLCSEETIGSEKSGNTADDGAASTRALAGSVLSYKVTVDSNATVSQTRDAMAEIHSSASSSEHPNKDHDTKSHSKTQDENNETWDRVRFDDNVSVYNESGSDRTPSSSSSLKLTSGRRSPSSGSLHGSMSVGRAIRHLLLQTRGSSEKLSDCEAQNN